MNCQRIQENLVDYQDGTLPAADAAKIRAHLATCADCQREFSALQEITGKLDSLAATPEPSPRLREKFYTMLAATELTTDTVPPFVLARSRLDNFLASLLPARPAYQFAFALALLLGGLFVGQHFLAKPAAVAPADDTARTELAALRAQVNSMGQLVTYSLLQQQSTSERLRAVLATMELKHPDRKILTDLVGTLVFDPSVNVRLSTVEALAQHADDSLVRAGVLSALPRETAPLVQVAMIELLVTAGDQSAKPIFEKLSRDEAIDRNVRDAARRALAALQPPTRASASPITFLTHHRQPSPV